MEAGVNREVRGAPRGADGRCEGCEPCPLIDSGFRLLGDRDDGVELVAHLGIELVGRHERREHVVFGLTQRQREFKLREEGLEE